MEIVGRTDFWRILWGYPLYEQHHHKRQTGL